MRVPELGWVPFPNKAILTALPKLKAVLCEVASGSLAPDLAADELQSITGIGRNLATKLLAIIDPSKAVVINEPVEKALRRFGYPIQKGPKISGKTYLKVIKDLNRFIEECDSLGLACAPALDAFFGADGPIAPVPS